MSRGELIGIGRTAEVYAWGKDKLVKLYFENFPTEAIEREADISRAVWEQGIPSPEVFGIVKVGNRKGLIFEKIPGQSMLSHIEARPWLVMSFGREMARLHCKIHGSSLEELPPQKARITQAIGEAADLLGAQTEKILDHLETLNGQQAVCHGDFHPDNILIRGSNAIAIDWTNAYSGHPASDVARTWIMINSPYLPEGSSTLLGLMSRPLKRLLSRAYLREYVRLAGTAQKVIQQWLIPVAAARLGEKLPGEKEWLLGIIQRH
ncbi:MAG: aminoglycoside phosphotransferase [Firmicutes bacterium]|nr:aminoglycoside phosphotransferase [Bacillota bacterium]